MSPTSMTMLDHIAAEAISKDVNLMPAILERLEDGSGIKPSRKRWQFAFTMVTALLALAIVTTAAYAIYRLLLDPGLKQAQEAGLLVDVNQTALPTIVPTTIKSPQPGIGETALLQVGESQTLEGVTLTLEQAYADTHRLALFWHSDVLPADYTFGNPELTFLNAETHTANGANQSLRNDAQAWTYSQFLVIQAEAGALLDVDVTVPLLQVNASPEWTRKAEYKFTVRGLPMNVARTMGENFTRAVTVNGIEARLTSMDISPSFTEVTLCYDFPPGDAPFWYLSNVTLRADDGEAVGYRTYKYLDEISDDHCARMGFPVGSGNNARVLNLSLNRMVVPLTGQDELPEERILAANAELAQYGIEIKPAKASVSDGLGGWQFVRRPEVINAEDDPRLKVLQVLEESMEGPWLFTIGLPADPDASQPTAMPEPTPMAQQAIGEVTVTLDWVYVDAKRASVAYTIRGLPDVPGAEVLSGTSAIFDPVTGSEVPNYSGLDELQRDEQEPGVIHGVRSWVFRQPVETAEVSFRFEMNLGIDGDMGENLGWFPPPVTTLTPTPPPAGYIPPRLPPAPVGKFSFDFTAPVAPIQKFGRQPAVVVNDVSMWVESAEVTPSFTSAVVCYNNPEPVTNDWTIWQIELEHAGKRANSNGFRLVYMKEFPKSDEILPDNPVLSMPYGRCYGLDFAIGSAGGDKLLTLHVPELEQSMPERAPDDLVNQAITKLKAQGIEMSWTVTQGVGGGGAGPVYHKLPADMTEQQAYRAFMEAMGYIYPGPWVMPLMLP